MNTLLSVPVNCVSDADLPAILPSKASDELQTSSEMNMQPLPF